MEYEYELAIALDVVNTANDIVRQCYGRHSEDAVSYKDDDSPLTEADTEANRAIVSELSSVFSRDGVLSEETVDDASRLETSRVWIVDPLDGTKEFIKRNGEFTVNVALVVGGEPVLGVIGVPAKYQVYYALKGHGAFFVDGTGESSRISVSSKGDVSRMTLAKSRSHASDKLQDVVSRLGIAHEVSSGSSVKGCLVASGDADLYIRLGDTHEWDICAMHVIISEAGGVLTDLSGRPVLYNRENTLIRGFVASNGKSHKDIVAVVKKS